MTPYVLVIGYRKQLAAALYKRGIPYSVWGDKPLKAVPPGVDQMLRAPFTRDIPELHNTLDQVRFRHIPTHIIAGGEAAVVTAAVMRRIYGTVRQPDTVAIRCTDKVRMKEYLTKHHIPMTQFIAPRPGLTAKNVVRLLKLPVVIKDRLGSGGRNMMFAATAAAVGQAMGPRQYYEAYIDAPEGSVESFINNGKILFSNVTEYVVKKEVNLLPARYSADELHEILLLNRRVLKAMKIGRGLVHLEFYRTDRGILFGELALRPPGGYIMDLLRYAYDFDPWDLFVAVELGLEIGEVPQEARGTAGCLVLHPGAGTALAVRYPRKEQYPTLVKSQIRVKVGEQISPRQGVSDDVGSCLFYGGNPQQVSDDIRRLRANPPILIHTKDVRSHVSY